MPVVDNRIVSPRSQRSFTGVSAAPSPVINATQVAKSNKSFSSPSNVYDLAKETKKNNDNSAVIIAQNLYKQNLENAEKINNMQYKNFEKQLKYNLRNWTQARDYDEYMSSTQYQRAIKDLKAAGLNPILATRLGGATYHGVGSYANSNTLPYYHIATNYMPQLDLNNYLGSAVNFANQDKLLGSYLGSSAISGVLNVIAKLLPFFFGFVG